MRRASSRPFRSAAIACADDAARRSDEADALNRRAEEFYFQFTRTDNEAAIALYERALAHDQGDAVALARLANGLVQRAVRWLGIAEGEPARSTLEQALDSGALASPAGLQILSRAQALAERAVATDRCDAAALKALGLVMAATRRFDDARRLYEEALAVDPKAWGVFINLADIDGMEGRALGAVLHLERAYEIMTGVYNDQAVKIRPWYAALGTLIADRRRAMGHTKEADFWYRRVLAQSPVT